MLPSIDVKTVRLSECRRVVLFNYNKEDSSVEMRHYAIRAQPVGISRSVKRIIQARIPNLGSLTDISEFIEGNMGTGGAASDSEAEEGANVTLSEKYMGRGNSASQQSAMKLSELGPRMTLEIFKVERGVGEGDVLYHKFQSKTPAEAAALKKRIEKDKLLKEQRRKVQEDNVARKKAAEEEKRLVKAENKRKRDIEKGSDDEEDSEDEEDSGEEEVGGGVGDDDDDDDDDDSNADYSDVDDGENISGQGDDDDDDDEEEEEEEEEE